MVIMKDIPNSIRVAVPGDARLEGKLNVYTEKMKDCLVGRLI